LIKDLVFVIWCCYDFSQAQDEEKKIMEQELKAKLTDPSTPLHFAVQREEVGACEKYSL
jgi:hypothetical protein